jgi:hypothetical protein
MKTFILAGSEAVEHLFNEKYHKLEKAILRDIAGEIYSFNPTETNALSQLLEQLKGWNDFTELSESDIKEIEENTPIQFDREENIKIPIFWSTNDFEAQAEQNFNELKESAPEEYKHLENWEQLYDKSKFAQELERMISAHDATFGITWLTVEKYLGNCEIK